jgi:predicted dehydrogenase
MNNKVRWGILSTANIGVATVIPAMQQGEWCEIAAIASRDLSKAKQIAEKLAIPTAYGSYEELLADPQIEAVYNPLPNHLHVPWTIKAAEAGKHSLCEKPIALNAIEASTLIDVRNRTGVRVQEAFMVHNHPRWLAARDMIRAGRIGQLKNINGSFSYFNVNPANIRNQREIGGGALMDIGCYPITISRFIFGAEPQRVVGLIERDPETGIDRLTSGLLDFPGGRSTFTCSTQLVPYQRMMFFGVKGRIEVPIPFNAPNDQPTRILIDDGSDLDAKGGETIEFPVCDQYTIQGDVFSRAIRENTEQAIPLEDAISNMKVIDALFRSAESGRWEELG